MYCRKRCGHLVAALTSCTGGWCLIKRAMSAEGRTGGRRLWLSSSSACHHLNITATFSSAVPDIVPSLLLEFSSCGKENKNTEKQNSSPLLLPLQQWRWEAGSIGCLFCSWGGGEGNVRYGLCLFLSIGCYSPAATLASSVLSGAGLLQNAQALLPALARRKPSSPASVEILQQLPREQQSNCSATKWCLCVWRCESLLCQGDSSCGKHCRNQNPWVARLCYLWSSWFVVWVLSS